MSASPSLTRVTAFCDGGSRGNPGPAGYGVFIQSEAGAPLAALSEFLGVKTNNVAEYSGLLAALSWALENQAGELRVVSDSELMVKQIKGQYSVKSPDLKPLYEEAKRRIAKQHVLRGKNKQADRLANEAMDKGMGRGVPQASQAEAMPPGRPAKQPPSGQGKNSHQPPTVKTSLPARTPLLPSKQADAVAEVTGFVKNGVVHLVEGELPEGTFVRILPARR